MNLKNALKSMENYLFGNLEHGFWIDFTKCHGGSTCWTTSYVARNLAENKANLERLSFVKDRIKFNQRRDGGWAYNHTSTSDAETTANCLLFLFKFPDTNEAVKEGIEYLLKHHDKITDGFLTYTEDEFRQYTNKRAGKGWCAPNVEVTSLIIRTLIESGYNGNEIQQSLEFIASEQDEDGSWKPYWWSSKEYAIVNSIEVLGKYPKYKENIKKALTFLTNKRRKNEIGWINDFTNKYSTFYSALALGILLKDKGCLIKEYKLNEMYQIAEKIVPELLEREIETLLKTQNHDGSFGPELLFRIPRYNITDVSKIKNWDIEVPHKNSVYRDDNRFFTTATVYSTILKYLDYLK